MGNRIASVASLAVMVLAGCPFGTPRGHHRPSGHLDTTLAVAPAGDAILFNAAGAGGLDLYLLHLADLQVTRVADTPHYETAASFSPDGTRIVYAAGIPGDRADHLFTSGLRGEGRTQLTDGNANDTSPRFSPDGKSIVFARDKTYNWGGLGSNWEPGGVICLMDADGTNLRQLTPDDGFAFEPQFTPDGKHVVYSVLSGRESVPVDSSAPPTAIPGPFGASVSPDGRLLGYSRGQYSGDSQICIANADGTSERLLTPGLGGCYRPVFAQPGDRVYFLRQEWPDGLTGDPKFSIWVAEVEGVAVRMVADRRLLDDPLGWQPRASR